MADEVELRNIPEMRVAYMRHVGPYGSARITEMCQRFASWCAAQGLTSSRRQILGIAQDNPNITPPDRTRYDVCIEVDADFQPCVDVGVQTVRGGRHACVRFSGTAAEIRPAWIRLLTRTLPNAGYEPELFGAIELHEPGFAIDPATGTFSCTLCMPVQTM